MTGPTRKYAHPNAIPHKMTAGFRPEMTTLTIAHQFTFKLFGALLAMSFLWVGSQIPLYLFGGILPDIYGEIVSPLVHLTTQEHRLISFQGGYDRWVWMIIAYLIPNAALCPFVGALSDLFGRKWVAMAGQIFLVVGPIVTATANEMNIAIGKQKEAKRAAIGCRYVRSHAYHFGSQLARLFLVPEPVSTSSSRWPRPVRWFPLLSVVSTSVVSS